MYQSIKNVIRSVFIVVMMFGIFQAGHIGVWADEISNTNAAETTPETTGAETSVQQTTTASPSTTEEMTTTLKDETTTKIKIKNGFYKKKGQTKYYINGKKYKGWLKLNNNKYYFNSKGNMVVGSKKIKSKYYYFNSKGVMKTGFVKVNLKKYYYSKKSGKRLYGFRKIGKYRYYLNQKTGEVTTGFASRKYKKSQIMNYYNSKGRLKTGTFRVDKVKYIAERKNGKIYSVRNLAPVICQRPQLPTGCEITAWTMMANYAGIKINKTTAANIMPKSSNPNAGFMGSPYSSSGKGLVVYPGGLSSMTKKYFGSYVNMTGCSIDAIKSKLFNKHLVMVWVVSLDGFGSHTVALTGYNKSGFFYNDPWTGTKRTISYGYFKSIWAGNAYRAMSY